ncbi:MAG: hypothetical protein KKF56_05070 [Nanoarchaeota archaeon]|nr:hypothetical protein [Nanoarchaeota archaeon]
MKRKKPTKKCDDCGHPLRQQKRVYKYGVCTNCLAKVKSKIYKEKREWNRRKKSQSM